MCLWWWAGTLGLICVMLNMIQTGVEVAKCPPFLTICTLWHLCFRHDLACNQPGLRSLGGRDGALEDYTGFQAAACKDIRVCPAADQVKIRRLLAGCVHFHRRLVRQQSVLQLPRQPSAFSGRIPADALLAGLWSVVVGTSFCTCHACTSTTRCTTRFKIRSHGRTKWSIRLRRWATPR